MGRIAAGIFVAVLMAASITPCAVEAQGRNASVACTGSQGGCLQLVLATLNAERARLHRAPLTLTMVQSNGRPGCAGSLGHSKAMASTGGIWHQNGQRPRASFPRNVCLSYTKIGENVGVSAS